MKAAAALEGPGRHSLAQLRGAGASAKLPGRAPHPPELPGGLVPRSEPGSLVRLPACRALKVRVAARRGAGAGRRPEPTRSLKPRRGRRTGPRSPVGVRWRSLLWTRGSGPARGPRTDDATRRRPGARAGGPAQAASTRPGHCTPHQRPRPATQHSCSCRWRQSRGSGHRHAAKRNWHHSPHQHTVSLSPSTLYTEGTGRG